MRELDHAARGRDSCNLAFVFIYLLSVVVGYAPADATVGRTVEVGVVGGRAAQGIKLLNLCKLLLDFRLSVCTYQIAKNAQS